MAKKRANGDGNLHKMPNDLWELTTMIGYQPDGRRKPNTSAAKLGKRPEKKPKPT